ncbi:gliding motility lipoprotein GldH [Algoriphagus sp. H41]|uniref:Gliding motility lipoprotein GldH n=1 Tax=Algoriphagus oliviformis TaxID=2811231 RepID=A0ABS3CBF4_9BACT|nr:gliding motility lipoprotein GldH [Algoriphagus oliviformis]MBN7812964.1 gliding motility lipoprotein GldH [Algoriphagus oliviformis]
MNKSSTFAAVALLAVASACGGDRAFEEFHSFQAQAWSERDTASFDLSALQSASGPKLIALKYNEEYPFSNCYVRVISSDSSGAVLDNKLINVPLFDSKSGQPMGKGFGNTFTRYDTLPFELSEGTAQVSFVQYMRQESLVGLEAVGLKILK